MPEDEEGWGGDEGVKDLLSKELSEISTICERW